MLASRLHIALAVLLTGCTGLIEEDLPDGVTPEQEAARRAWVIDAQPVLQENCASCHDGSRAGIGWFEGGPDIEAQRTDLLTYVDMAGAGSAIVDLAAPQTSKLITHGAHEGPALTSAQASGLINWMNKEREAQPDRNDFPVQLAPQALMPCMGGAPGSPSCPYNDFLLDAAGAAGAKIQFTATLLSDSIYIADLKVVPGPMGVYIEHPIFVTVPVMGDPVVDPLDRYFRVMKNLASGAAAAEQQIENGTTSFVGFPTADPLAIYFQAVGPMKP